MSFSISHIILKMAGWKISGSMPSSLKKCIVVMAPHTSNWDFFIGWLGFNVLGLKSKYLIKKEAFFFPLGTIVRKIGGIPVDRGKSTNIILQITELFKERNELILTVTPEGTRSLNRNWKKGFYTIALHANVPIVLGFLDYKKKIGGLGPIIMVTGDFEKDMEMIEAFYADKTARFPENFNLSPQNFQKRIINQIKEGEI
ncbi:MAG: 1-acyl-sn-glycerol-3-phosphate acyltransferase [Bacteroidales bacterium]|nr:1-acyl-sn-glycerol-3-phosphate acyltransferase [Bacteroidales bacterium]